MELTKNYIPAAVEDKWYRHWLENKYFSSNPDNRKPFTVVIPPPNVTGVLHMGHTLNETVQDILVRNARMNGYNACWVPGSDHASIATEAKVVQMLKEKGIDKNTLSRTEFLKYAFEWKEKYGNIIYNQIARLGCSVDWERVSFTMDDHYYQAVIKVFVDLYRKGLIYRGARMINWDPSAKTALSDEEVEYKEIRGKLYYVKYPLADPRGTGDYLVIATQRPETIMGDTAVCVNPQDERYARFKGKKVLVPFVNREVPVIFDEYVDPAFGTGALKITPAHDINDYNIGLKHSLEVINTLNEDGTLSEAAGVFVGMDRFEARKSAVDRLRREGLLVKEEEYTTRMGYSQRTNAVVEPRISTQWFVKMKALAEPALNAVVSGEIRIHPGEKFLATYKYWLENVKDWCISRQLWWGQQIPAWYDQEGKLYVAETEAAAAKLAAENRTATDDAPGQGIPAISLRRDEDVLDTWFSSWLWPIEVFKGISNPGNPDFAYYYPTSVLVTGQDIIFFWVARMIMAGMEFEKTKPFGDVYFTGMVRDKLGRKMSKSLGNSPDLLTLIDKYGADAVRFGIMISSPAGNDLLFDESSLEQGRNFNNKLWNVLKLIKSWEERLSENSGENSGDSFAVAWFDSRLGEAKSAINDLLQQFSLSEALKRIYSLIWDDFCSWYIEWVKPSKEETMPGPIYHKTVYFLEELLQLLHPYMPFITEEIYHLLKPRTPGDDLAIKQAVIRQDFDEQLLGEGEILKRAITAIREFRNKNQLSMREKIQLGVHSPNPGIYRKFRQILPRQVHADWSLDPMETEGVSKIISDRDVFYIKTEQKITTEALRGELLKELEHQNGFLLSVQKKLLNDRFIQNAKPEVIALEKKKAADALLRIKTIEESLANL